LWVAHCFWERYDGLGFGFLSLQPPWPAWPGGINRPTITEKENPFVFLQAVTFLASFAPRLGLA